MLISAFFMALREIRRNVMRTMLTTLGIVIGVGAVIALVTLGEGATAKVQNDVSSLGNNMLTLSPGAARMGPVSTAASPLTKADVKAISEQISGITALAPMVSSSSLVVFGNKNYNTSVNGSNNDWFKVRGWALERGRNFSDTELAGGSPACVLGATVVKQLFGSQNPIDSSIRVGNVPCKVIGVLASKGQSTFGQDQDDLMVMPMTVVQRRIRGTTNIDSITMSVASSTSSSSVISKVQLLMRERRRIASGADDDFNVRDLQEIAKTLSNITGALTALLGGIAAVSLLVGGIGIMNIMLVSVTERTREIGIRLAIGALANEVLIQFLVESIVLSALGGLLGVALGLGSSALATKLLGLPFVFMPSLVLVAFVFSAGVGVVFGYLPARKAARLNPIDALRHE